MYVPICIGLNPGRNILTGSKDEMNGAIPLTRLSHSVPGSPVEDRLNAAEVIGSAENLVGRVFTFYTIKMIINSFVYNIK